MTDCQRTINDRRWRCAPRIPVYRFTISVRLSSSPLHSVNSHRIRYSVSTSRSSSKCQARFVRSSVSSCVISPTVNYASCSRAQPSQKGTPWIFTAAGLVQGRSVSRPTSHRSSFQGDETLRRACNRRLCLLTSNLLRGSAYRAVASCADAEAVFVLVRETNIATSETLGFRPSQQTSSTVDCTKMLRSEP